jgi:hypothetical protein
MRSENEITATLPAKVVNSACINWPHDAKRDL